MEGGQQARGAGTITSAEMGPGPRAITGGQEWGYWVCAGHAAALWPFMLWWLFHGAPGRF